jgi:enolase
MHAIKKISALEILDSRGNPTVKATVELENGVSASAAVPSGASTGTHEALELRDKDRRYGGMGVLTACENVNNYIQKGLAGYDILNQQKIDDALIKLDGTENKSRLGANSILAVSLASARAASKSENIPLYKYLSKTFKFKNPKRMPTAFFNIINGGAHADSGLSIQEFQIIPHKIRNFSEQLRAGSEIYHHLKKILSNTGYSTGVGDEGGFVPRVESHNAAFEFIAEAISASGFKNKVFIGIDAAVSFFFDPVQNIFTLKPENISLEPERIIPLYQEWLKKYGIISLEDCIGEDDFENWKKINEKLGNEALIIGDDLLVTNINRLKKALDFSAVNAAIVKPNQIGTLSETMEFIKFCQKNKIKCVVSHRSGETEDDFIADLAVAAGAEFVKFGAPCRSERTAKYNRLLEIENEIK